MKDNKESFRESIFAVVEFLTEHSLKDRGRTLVLHYFNDSGESNSYLRALEAIEKYYPESMPEEDTPPKLQALLDAMKREAALWDSEGNFQ